MEAERRREEIRVMQKAINNPLIAEKIFKQAEFADKKNIRLVSRFWRDSTLEEWRSNSAAIRIKFTYESEGYSGTMWCHSTNYLLVEAFERMMEGRQKTINTNWPALFLIQEKPFRRVILVNGYFSLPPDGGRYLKRSVAYVEYEFKMFKFLEKFGFPLKYLRTQYCGVHSESYEMGMKWMTMRACPALKELSLDISIPSSGLSNQSMFDFQDFSTPGPERSNLKKLKFLSNVRCTEDVWRTMVPERNITVEQILCPFPNLKCLAMDWPFPRFPLEEALCVPMANGKYLQLEQLDLPIHAGTYEDDWAHKEALEALSKYIELARPSFKKFRIHLDFSKYYDFENFSRFDPVIDQFFTASGHLLTHLEIELRKPSHLEEPELASQLTGHNFPCLTHLTIIYKRRRWTCCSEGFACPGGSLYFDFAAFQGMPRLQVFNCFDRIHGSEGEFSMAYQNLPIELNELKEFSFHFGDKLTVASLRMILGWMPSVKKLALYLDEATFPGVFEMAPQLEQLILLGKDGGLTPAERDSGEIWIGRVERERQEMEWKQKTKWRSLAERKISKKKAKEIAQKEKCKLKREKMREEMEKEEKDWIGKQEKVEGEWTYVSYRNRRGNKGKDDPALHFPPRQPQPKGKGWNRNVVDDFTVFCKLKEMNTGNRTVRIFRDRIEYKIGGLE